MMSETLHRTTAGITLSIAILSYAFLLCWSLSYTHGMQWHVSFFCGGLYIVWDRELDSLFDDYLIEPGRWCLDYTHLSGCLDEICVIPVWREGFLRLPLWPLLFLATMWLAVAVRPVWIRRQRWRMGLCPRCGYDWNHIDNPVQCSECGAAWRSPPVCRSRICPWFTRDRMLMLIAGALLVATTIITNVWPPGCAQSK